VRRFCGVFRVQQRDVGADRWIVGVLLQVIVYAGARVRKQHLMNELDRRGGAFDVQQDRANVVQRERAPLNGM
jgi:DNA phosphorothioation-dependent restriction protein DptG